MHAFIAWKSKQRHGDLSFWDELAVKLLSHDPGLDLGAPVISKDTLDRIADCKARYDRYILKQKRIGAKTPALTLNEWLFVQIENEDESVLSAMDDIRHRMDLPEIIFALVSTCPENKTKRFTIFFDNIENLIGLDVVELFLKELRRLQGSLGRYCQLIVAARQLTMPIELLNSELDAATSFDDLHVSDADTAVRFGSIIHLSPRDYSPDVSQASSDHSDVTEMFHKIETIQDEVFGTSPHEEFEHAILTKRLVFLKHKFSDQFPEMLDLLDLAELVVKDEFVKNYISLLANHNRRRMLLLIMRFVMVLSSLERRDKVQLSSVTLQSQEEGKHLLASHFFKFVATKMGQSNWPVFDMSCIDVVDWTERYFQQGIAYPAIRLLEPLLVLSLFYNLSDSYTSATCPVPISFITAINILEQVDIPRERAAAQIMLRCKKDERQLFLESERLYPPGATIGNADKFYLMPRGFVLLDRIYRRYHFWLAREQRLGVGPRSAIELDDVRAVLKSLYNFGRLEVAAIRQIQTRLSGSFSDALRRYHRVSGRTRTGKRPTLHCFACMSSVKAYLKNMKDQGMFSEQRYALVDDLFLKIESSLISSFEESRPSGGASEFSPDLRAALARMEKYW